MEYTDIINKELKHIFDNHDKDMSINTDNISPRCKMILFRTQKKIYNKLYHRYRKINNPEYTIQHNKQCKERKALKKKQKNESMFILV